MKIICKAFVLALASATLLSGCTLQSPNALAITPAPVVRKTPAVQLSPTPRKIQPIGAFVD